MWRSRRGLGFTSFPSFKLIILACFAFFMTCSSFQVAKKCQAYSSNFSPSKLPNSATTTVITCSCAKRESCVLHYHYLPVVSYAKRDQLRQPKSALPSEKVVYYNTLPILIFVKRKAAVYNFVPLS